MPDSFTEVTNTSWFSRIKSALSGILIGLGLILAAIIALFWNEGRAVETARSLYEGAGLVVSVDPSKLTAEKNGKLVHFTGSLTPNGVPSDTLFSNLELPVGTTRLVRQVEMYQWMEDTKTKTRKKIGGGEEKTTVYSYSQKWSERQIKSANFKKLEGHQNPTMPLKSETFGVENGAVGSIVLEGRDFQSLGTKMVLAPNDVMENTIAEKLGQHGLVSISGEAILIGDTINTARIGDLRITFYTAKVETLSGIGKLNDGKITAYETTNGRKISMFREGAASAKEMFDTALSNNAMLTWALRLGGFMGMLIGFKMLFSVLGVIGDVIPFVGDVVRFASGLLAFALTAVISALVIGFAWVYFRPVLGYSIIAAGILLGIGAMYLGKAKSRKVEKETGAATA
ncbi:MAG: TMEM43 family protein [Rhizobiaceae bacterium]